MSSRGSVELATEPRIVSLLHSELTFRNPRHLTTRKKASVAIVLRPASSSSKKQSHTSSSSSSLSSLISEAELLFIKRATNPKDHWSGNVAFPGGRCDPTDSDECATAIRETKEEVGLDISESSGFVCIGRMNDLQTIDKDLSVSPFVFWQKNADYVLPPLVLHDGEVADARWFPLSLITPENVDPLLVPVSNHGVFRRLPPKLVNLLGPKPMHFPGILLNAVRDTPAADTSKSRERDSETEFNLWGFTLRCSCELVRLTAISEARCKTNSAVVVHRRLAWPPCTFARTFPNLVTYAYCGTVELSQYFGALRGLRSSRLPIRGLHIGCTFAAICMPFTLIAICKLL